MPPPCSGVSGVQVPAPAEPAGADNAVALLPSPLPSPLSPRSPLTPPVWLFGYGSLIWRPAIAHTATFDGYITPYRRAFYQASTDHRGTPDAPGRVVTLITPPPGGPPVSADDPTWRVYGRAFRLPDASASAIMAEVDVREQGGYRRTAVAVHPVGGGPPLTDVICYVGDEANPMWRGSTAAERDEAAIAAIIDTAVGPSGANDEYLERLHDALSGLGGDPHVAALVSHLHRRRVTRATGLVGGGGVSSPTTANGAASIVTQAHQ